MSDLKLDEKLCTDIIVNSLEMGQRKGSFTIKDASVIFQVILYLRKDIKPKDHPEINKQIAFDTLIKAIVLANSKGSYGIEDAALIDKVVLKLQELNLTSKPEESKIQEIAEPKMKDSLI